METCSLQIEVVCSWTIQEQYILELFKNNTVKEQYIQEQYVLEHFKTASFKNNNYCSYKFYVH